MSGGASRPVVIATLGVAQILAWGSSYYLPAVLARPIAADTGWPLAWVVGGVSLGLLVAGLASPRIGRIIEARGGRMPMAASTVLMAAGLVALTLAPTLALHVACWAVIGLGMAAGLYDATFATLGRQYGQQARSAIASMTLIGGFANTVCWPLSAFLLAHLGWRGACLCYAAIDVFLLLPAYLLVLPARPPAHAVVAKAAAHEPPPAGLGLFVLLAGVNTFGLLISATFSIHLLNLLVARGLAPATAVAFGAALGPAQIVGRLAIIFGARRLHPVWTLFAWTTLVAIGLVLLWLWPRALAVGVACYGAGIGIGSIARGTTPLALFGAAGYATRMGVLAMPALLAQAAAPILAALLMQRAGADATLGVLAWVAVLDLALAAGLVAASRGARASAARPG